VLIAGFDALFATGPRTGLYLAFACFAAFALVSERIGRVVTGAPWLGLGAALVLLLGPNMLLIEMAAGRTIPLHLLLCAMILLGLLKGARITMAQALGIGFIAGLTVLNRFDALPLPVLTALAIGWLTRSPPRALAALSTAALAVSPWAAYSLTTFGTFFATDNAAAASLLDPAAYVTDWWPAAQQTIADQPLAWAAKVAANAVACVLTAASLLVSPMGLAALAFLAGPASVTYLAADRPRANERLLILTGFAIAAAAMLVPQVLTGYLDHRYFSLFWWSIFLATACWGISQSRKLHQRMIAARIGVGLAALIVASGLLSSVRSDGFDAARWAAFDAPGDVRSLAACTGGAPGARILVLGNDELAARAGALAGLGTMMEPRNMREGRLGASGSRAFLDAWAVDFVLVADPGRSTWAQATFPIVRDTACPIALYRVMR
jgi:hypothetical protein